MTGKYKNVAVFGLGFIGLPLALSFSMNGKKVIGVDVSEELIRELNSGITHHLEEYKGTKIEEILKKQLRENNFEATTDAEYALEKCNNVIVTVGIPVAEGGKLHIEHLESVSRTIACNLKKGDLIVFRGTLVPGFMRDFIKPILEESRLEAGKDFYLGYASERVAEGKAFEEFENMPTLVSGINEKSIRETTGLLEVITKADIIPASSFEVVETAKVLENISRDINIAMVNEFAKFTRALGIDIFEVIKVANTHKRVNLLNPGPGVGGYCIPNAFYYLNAKGKELDIDLELSSMARKINKDTPVRVAQIALEKLTSKPEESKICILGMAMKDYSSDDRLSPAFDVIKTLQEKGVDVAVYDPAISNDYDYLVEDINKALKDADGIIILAKQEGINLKDLDRFKEMLKDNNPFILDTKNVYTREEVETKGILYESI